MLLLFWAGITARAVVWADAAPAVRMTSAAGQRRRAVIPPMTDIEALPGRGDRDRGRAAQPHRINLVRSIGRILRAGGPAEDRAADAARRARGVAANAPGASMTL